MSYFKENKNTIIYGSIVASVVILGTTITYYVLEDDKRVKRRKEEKRAQRTTVRLLQQIREEEVLPIEFKIKEVENNIEDKTCDDKAFKLKEYTLAHSNELLLRLMEKLDTIRPQSVVMGTAEDTEPSEFQAELISNIKSKKKAVLDAIQDLCRRLDLVNARAKIENTRREEEAKQKALFEKEEAERKAREEKELEEFRKEQERKAKEEQELIAQQEALRRQEEEKENQAEQLLSISSSKEEDIVILNEDELISSSTIEIETVEIPVEEEEEPAVENKEN